MSRTAGLALALTAGLATLTGCASGPPADALPDMPATPAGWQSGDAAGAAGADPDALRAWWRRFDDPQLDALVDRALQASTRVQGAQAALRQAQALRDVAAAALWPTLDASASAQRGLAGGHSTGNSLQLGLTGQWTIDIAGARRAALDAGQATAEASAASLGDLQVQVAAAVALDHILLRTAQARGAIARANLASQQETLQLTAWRQQAGLVTALEVAQARAAVQQNQAALPPLQTAATQAQHALSVLTGQAPQAGPDLAADPAPAPAGIPQARDGLVPDVPASTLRQRADVRAAERQVAAALARVGQARAQRWPSFAIGGSLGLAAASVGALGQGPAALASLLASVALPVFDGGALRAQVLAQQAALAQAQQAYRAAVLGALQQVEDALAALHGDRLRLAALRLAADAAAEAALLARQRYGSGLIDFQTVLDTQRTQYATQDGVASAAADVGSDQVRLFTALGGGWAVRPAPAAASATPAPLLSTR